MHNFVASKFLDMPRCLVEPRNAGRLCGALVIKLRCLPSSVQAMPSAHPLGKARVALPAPRLALAGRVADKPRARPPAPEQRALLRGH